MKIIKHGFFASLRMTYCLVCHSEGAKRLKNLIFQFPILILTLLFVSCNKQRSLELTTLEDIKDSYAKAIKGDKKAINFLIDNLGNKNSEIQQESYISITKIGYPATPFLVELLKNDDPDLQEYAAGALGTIKDKQSFPALLDALSSSSFKRKYIICRALGKISDPIAIKPLISIYLEQTEDTKKYIVRALVDIGHPSVPVLLENLKNANPEIQKMSIIALGEIKGSDISKALIEISNNTNRDLVIYSLGQIADTTSIDFLLPLLKDPDWQIRQKTAFALTKYTNKKILPALNAALNDEVAIVREWVATAIECISGERCKYKNEKGELVYSHGLYH